MSVGQLTSVIGQGATSPKLKITTVFPDSGNFTVMCWAYHTGGTGDAYSDMFGITDTNDVIGMTLHAVGGVRKFSMGDLNSDIDGLRTIPDNEWNHYCITVTKVPGTGTRAIGYLNGVEHMSGSLINPVTPTQIEIFNSRASDTDSGGVWIGNITALKVWTGKALTPEEIRKEVWCYTPQRKLGLWAWSPMIDVDQRTANYGGLAGIDWTTQSTIWVAGSSNPGGVVWDAPQARRGVFTAATSPSVATAAGTSTVAGTGLSTALTVGSATGTGAANATGRATALSTASAAGTGTASGSGVALTAGVGTATGAATANATGSALATAIASATTLATVLATGLATALSTASAAGLATVTGIAVTIGSIGTAIATSIVAAVGQALAVAIGTATTTSTVTGISGNSPSNPTGSQDPMPNFNFHVNPLYAETLVVSNAVKQLTQTVYDGTSDNKAYTQMGNKRRKARVAKVTVDTANSIRWTKDGTAPVAATTGALGRQFDVIYLESYAEIIKFKAIRDGASDSSIQVEYYG